MFIMPVLYLKDCCKHLTPIIGFFFLNLSGKTLNKNLEAFLTDTGLIENAKVMLLGKKVK